MLPLLACQKIAISIPVQEFKRNMADNGHTHVHFAV